MTVEDFIAKWERVTKERTAAQTHFNDLCEEKLDAAVAAAYGWTWPMTEDEILAALLALNFERAGD